MVTFKAAPPGDSSGALFKPPEYFALNAAIMFSWENVNEVVSRFLHLRSTEADEAVLELCSELPV